MHHDYMRIRSECCLVTATDSRYAPYLFNALRSIRERFPDHPRVRIFDLGISRWQRRELSRVVWAQITAVEPFVGHWKLNWSWKPFILTQVPERYVLYFDASNIVLYRSLAPWFGVIARDGYILFENGQQLAQTTPAEYWSLFGLDAARFARARTFGAGLMGFDRGSPVDEVLKEVLARTIEGWTLGCSANETRRAYDRSVIRDCDCFRADQTLFNLAFRRRYLETLRLRDELRYCGHGGPRDHPRQYLWYARRRRDSLIYFWRPLGSAGFAFLLNRIVSYFVIAFRDFAIACVRYRDRWRRRARMAG